MKYLICVYQTYMDGNSTIALETSKVVHRRLSTAKRIASNIFTAIQSGVNDAVYVAVFKDGQRIFLLSKEKTI